MGAFLTTLTAIAGAAKGVAGVGEFVATLWGGSKSAKQTEKINEKYLEMYKGQLEREEEQQDFQNAMAEETLAMSKRGMRFNEREAGLNRAEKTEEKGYNRLQNAANKYAEILNKKTALTSARLNPILGRGR